jgi:predicted O-methyltransferase YrrM
LGLSRTPDVEARKAVDDRIASLHGGVPFDPILREAEKHREQHGPACGLYPAGPRVMRLAATILRAARPMRILDLGAGFGYSSLWLARACDPDAKVEAIDHFQEHVARAEGFAQHSGLAHKVDFIVGDVSDVLDDLKGTYDFIHDDAWFAAAPPYYERVLALLRPGGTLTMPNWFLLEDAITGKPRRDWSELAGPDWPASTIAYAKRLANDNRLEVARCVSPPLAVAVRR